MTNSYESDNISTDCKKHVNQNRPFYHYEGPGTHIHCDHRLEARYCPLNRFTSKNKPPITKHFTKKNDYNSRETNSNGLVDFFLLLSYGAIANDCLIDRQFRHLNDFLIFSAFLF